MATGHKHHVDGVVGANFAQLQGCYVLYVLCIWIMLQFVKLQGLSAQADARACDHSRTRACCSWALRLADSSAAKASTSRVNVTHDKKK